MDLRDGKYEYACGSTKRQYFKILVYHVLNSKEKKKTAGKSKIYNQDTQQFTLSLA